MHTLALMTALGMAMAPPVLAEARKTQAERQIEEINEALRRQQRELGEAQQNQFEINQLRQDLGRRRLFAPSPEPGVVCPPEAGACPRR